MATYTPSLLWAASWALCNGQLLPIDQNQALFSLLGTTYGGDGRTTFALPDLQSRVPVGQGQSPGAVVLRRRPGGRCRDRDAHGDPAARAHPPGQGQQ